MAMHVQLLASGESVTTLDPSKFAGKAAKEVKEALTSHVGVSRFRQRLLAGDGTCEVADDEIFASDGGPLTVNLVKLAFCPPNAALDQQMIDASRGIDTARLEELLRRPRNPNVMDEFGHTPLHYAALNGRLEAMRLLLEAGADKDALSVKGRTPLHFAARSGR